MTGTAQLPAIIVQRAKSTGITCTGFSCLPIANPCLLAIDNAPSEASATLADYLHDAIIEFLTSVTTLVPSTEMPCQGRAETLLGCSANIDRVYTKLLAVVSDGATRIRPDESYERWLAASPSHRVLCVFPADASVTPLLPPSIAKYQVARWLDGVTDALPDVLAVLGITPEDFRIFITYRRDETADLAEQVFDALHHERFDVFLDRFRIDPGLDFQVRLTEELAHKSLVMAIESPGILESRWTQHEINFAIAHRLGILAVHVPGGTRVDEIEDDERWLTEPADYQDDDHTLLRESVMKRLIGWVKQHHAQALLRRREELQRSLTAALVRAGLAVPGFGPNGVFRLNPLGSKRRYAIWLTTRPPDLLDFHESHVRSPVPDVRGVVVGPAAYFHPRTRGRVDWLATVCGVPYYEETVLNDVAARLAAGTL